MHGHASLVLGDPRASVVGVDPIGAKALQSGLIQNPVQLSAMNANFGQWIAGMATARFPVDVLAEAVEKHALQIFYAHRLELGLHTERREFTHGMGQQRDAHAQLLDLRDAFVHIARHATLVHGQGKSQASDTAADHHHTGLPLLRHVQSAEILLRLITSPQRG